MTRTAITALLATCAIVTVGANEASASHARGPYSVEVVMNGSSQPVYAHGGQSFVAGAYGSAYQIRVHNSSDRRIEAIVAVDGRDVITGQPVDPRRHRGYIVGPYSATTVDGFRSSTASVATFRFATVPESYAWRTGTASGIGTIRVWVFEEEAPVVFHPPVMPWGAGAPRASRAAPGAGASAEAAPPAMGTEYGEARWSPVSYTTFQRRSRRADAHLDVRYNSYEMLAAAGIVAPVHHPYPTPVCYGYGCVEPGFAPPPPPQRVYLWR
jgi:hypothetical protein